MRKTRFSEEQIINILEGVEAGQRAAIQWGELRSPVVPLLFT